MREKGGRGIEGVDLTIGRFMINTIYIIRNTINHKIYVGQTWTTLSKRWSGGRGYKRCPYFYNAILDLGPDVFFYEEICCTTDQESADYLEQYIISYYNTTDKNFGYDIALGGSGSRKSDETKKKMSDAHLIENVRNKCIEAGKIGAATSKEINKIKHIFKPKKLSKEQVLEILQSTLSNTELAKIYNVSRRTIYKVRAGKY
jgi:hypothetical protein